MESVFFSMICMMLVLSCSYSKPVEKSGNVEKRGATDDDCYGTNCYFDPGYYEDNVDVEVTFPENLTQAVLSALPNIQGSQGKIVTLLNQSLVTSSSTLPNIEDSQAKLVALLNQSLVTSSSTLSSIEDSQAKIVTFLNQSMEQNEDILETMATMSTSLQKHDEQIANLTSTLSVLLVNVASLLQDQLNVLKRGAAAEPVCPNQHDAVTAAVTNESTKTTQGTTEIPVPQDCQVLAARGPYPSGSYRISPSDESGSFQVFCDMEKDGGGWTVIQKRYDGSLDFNEEWNEYEHGFGDVNGEHWIGLRNIRRLVSQKGTSWVLRIDLESFDNDTAYAVYDSFMIGDAESNYTLSVGSYSENAGDAIKYADKSISNWYQNGMQFSTPDRDNDNTIRDIHCADDAKGGWWYNRTESVSCCQSEWEVFRSIGTYIYRYGVEDLEGVELT